MVDTKDLETRIRFIEDQFALQKVMSDYRTLADSFRYEEWAELFSEDALFIIPPPFGEQVGRKGIYDACIKMNRGVWENTQHNLINMAYDIQGDLATAVGDMIYIAVPKGGVVNEYFNSFLRYNFTFVRTGEGWKIKNIDGVHIADNSGKDWGEVFGQKESAAV